MQVGDVIDGKYQVELVLGEGGMGRVVAATHRVLGTTVAIKALKPDGARIPEVAKRFLREARAASRLRSEHVAQVMDVGQLPSGEPYMVMQMLHGADLASVIKQGPIPPGIAAEYIVQACEGLAEAHGMGMVHRDVKPANLFLTKRPNGDPLVKVLDFGIATAAHGELDRSLTMTNMVMGSPNYMSPEQLRSTRSVDARSDIWSLGVTLYEMIAGRNPFEGATFTALTIMIATEPHQSLSTVTPELAAVVDRCLAKEPEQRYANVAELAAALAPFAERSPDRSAVDRMLGALKSAVPPTLHTGAPSVPPSYLRGGAAPAQASWTPHVAPSPSPTTSQLLSGESPVPPAPPPAKSRTVWIVVGGLLLGAAAVGAVVLLSRPAEETVVASAPPPVVRPSLKVEPIEPPKETPSNQDGSKSDVAKSDSKADTTNADATRTDGRKADAAKTDGSKPDESKTDENQAIFSKHDAPSWQQRVTHVKAAEELFAKGKTDAALDELLAIDDIAGLDVYKVSKAVDKLRRRTTSDKIRLAVALLALPPLAPEHPVAHKAATAKPSVKDSTPPAKDPTPPARTPCAPSDPKCGL